MHGDTIGLLEAADSWQQHSPCDEGYIRSIRIATFKAGLVTDPRALLLSVELCRLDVFLGTSLNLPLFGSTLPTRTLIVKWQLFCHDTLCRNWMPLSFAAREAQVLNVEASRERFTILPKWFSKQW